MSHDLYATWATTEIVRQIKLNPALLLTGTPNSNQLTAYANRESGRSWPIPDGRISADYSNRDIEIAIELKRTNEGPHGILTAIGQSQAYIHKGYHGSAIVVPDSYNTHSSPGNYIHEVLNRTNTNQPIGVFSYSEPDILLKSPFIDRLTCHRPISFDLATPNASNSGLTPSSNTQWAHLREGSSESHAFFKYLQTAKRVSSFENSVDVDISYLPQELIDASQRISTNSPLNYLSYATGTSLHDLIWRTFWFENILKLEVARLWISKNPYIISNSPTDLILENGNNKMFFSGRSDSIKNKMIQQLNANTISENEAWKKFALNIHKRAHSYREDIDSGLSHLGFLEDDGRPTNLGYRFIDICERTKQYYSGQAKRILGSAILKNGDLGVLLHYFYKISEELFATDPMKYSTSVNGSLKFDKDQYLNDIKNELATNLNVMNTATIRGGTSRKAFQGELSVLSKFGFIGPSRKRFRIGNGLLINWPLIQEYLDFEI